MGAGSIWWVPVLFGGSWWCLVAATWWLTLLGRLEPFFLFWQQSGCFSGKEVLAQQHGGAAGSTLQCLLSGMEQHLGHLYLPPGLCRTPNASSFICQISE